MFLRKMRLDKPVNYVAAAIVLFIFVWFFAGGYAASSLGFDASISDGLLAVFPGLFILVTSAFSVLVMRGVARVFGFGVLGVSIALIIDEAYDAGIIVDNMLGLATVTQVEALFIIVFLCVGALTMVKD